MLRNVKMKAPIYLDYMATTPCDPDVVMAMQACLDMSGCFGNPASKTHIFGDLAYQRVLEARDQVASLINADGKEIVWTSGATESDNLAIKGAALFYQRQGKHIITMSTEHKAVLDACKNLESQGFEVSYLSPNKDGLLNLDELKKSIRDDTILISIMHVNNETGVIQDIDAITKIAKDHGIIMHCDATQAIGKLSWDVKKTPVDLLSFSAHKIYGPKGVGGLYVRHNPRVRLEPQIHGGGHQAGMRSGTLPTHQIVGMGEAFKLASQRFSIDNEHVELLRDALWSQLSQLPNVTLNGDADHSIPGVLNIRINDIQAETLILRCPGIAISSGSACNSANPKPSHVLAAMGLSDQAARECVRISVGRFTTQADVDNAAKILCQQITELRALLPVTLK